MNKNQSRRRFLETSIVAGTGMLAISNSLIGAPAIVKNIGTKSSLINGVQIGVITYSFRSMEDQSAEATLQYIKDSGISAVELMGGPAESFAGMPENPVDRREFWALARKSRSEEGLKSNEQKELEEMKSAMEAHNGEVLNWREKVSMAKFEEMKKMYADVGVTIYAFKPRAFGKNNADSEIDYGMRAAKALGASHVTLEHPGDDAHTAKLGEMATKHKVYVAYHGHLQQTPTFWDTALEQSNFNALNLDVGHYVAADNPSVLDLVNAKHDKILSMHTKDRQSRENGQANLPWGEGDTPITELLNTMSEKKYTFPATIELEYKIPEDSNAVKEVKRCLEYCRSALEA